MITAWDVYLVMQLDSLIGLFIFFGVVAVVVAAGCTIGYVESSYDKPAQKTWSKYFKLSLASVFFSAALATLTPSSRTAAAMLLVPALTSPEVLQPVGAEAKELYGLAKAALRKLGTDKSKDAP